MYLLNNDLENIDDNLVLHLQQLVHQQAIGTVFQPIIHLTTGEIIGYEALSRGPADNELASPTELLQAASRAGMIWEVESCCRNLAIKRFAHSKIDTLLFLNVSPTIVQDERFCQGISTVELAALGMKPNQIVFEITEQVVVNEPMAFRELLDKYRQQGFKLAMDDVGAGYAGLTLISQLHPHYLKLDRSLISGVADDPLRQHLVRSLAAFTTGMGMCLIAEGLETDEDLSCVYTLGIRYGQGFLLARPAETPTPLDHSWRERLLHNVYGGKLLSQAITLNSICRTVPPITPNITVENLSKRWQENSSFSCIPVVDEKGIPMGLITREVLFSYLATPYGFSLYSRKPVTSVMAPGPLILEHDVSVETAALKALDRADSQIYEHLLVTKNGVYHGMVTVKDILAHLTSQSLTQAQSANPLTGLPGNTVIHAELARVLATGVNFTLCYCDLDRFKAFNDAYGFTRGDAVIQALSTLLQASFGPQSNNPAFIGHIGGDDFLVLSDNPLPQTTLERLLQDFDQTILSYYDDDAQKLHALQIVSRQGEVINSPLCSLSVAVVTADNGPFPTPHSLTQRAAEMKHHCKTYTGSSVCFDRRNKQIDSYTLFGNNFEGCITSETNEIIHR